MIRIALLSLALAGMAGSAAAQSSSTQASSDKSAQDLPPGVFMGGKDLADARAGSYAIDPDHSAVLARVQHIGYSWSVFRFDRVSGTLGWDPNQPEKSTLKVAVVVESITSNVKGFASELAGDNYLKAAKFPEAIFVSAAFRRNDATHGKVDGQLTLMGITKPVTFDVELIGAGKGWADMPRLGVQAVASIVPTDFGLPALFGRTIEIVVDTEFQRTP